MVKRRRKIPLHRQKFGPLQGLLFMLAFFLVGLTAMMVWWVPFLTHATTGR